jgi:hypothetical protein
MQGDIQSLGHMAVAQFLRSLSYEMIFDGLRIHFSGQKPKRSQHFLDYKRRLPEKAEIYA